MDDYTEQYTSSKNSFIFLAARRQVVSFKPFLETLSYSKEQVVNEINKFFGKLVKNGGVKEERKISFKVVATNFNEAIENHKKFQKLIRMTCPHPDEKSNTIHIRFTNLLSDYEVRTLPNYNYQQVLDTGIKCTLPSGFDYKPDMDLGFFDLNGLLFAKAFTLDLDLKILTPDPRKISVNILNKSLNDSDFYKQNEKNFPGRMFGFPVPYSKKQQKGD